MAIQLIEISPVIRRDLLKVLKRNSDQVDYGALVECTEQWVTSIKNTLDTAQQLRRTFMERSKIQFYEAREEISNLILERFVWRHDASDWKW